MRNELWPLLEKYSSQINSHFHPTFPYTFPSSPDLSHLYIFYNDYVHCSLHMAQSQMGISCSFNSNFSVSEIVKYGGFVAWPSADFPVVSISFNSMVLVETVSAFLHGLSESRN